MKKIIGFIVLLSALVGLAACSSTDANGIPNILQDQYTGYSESPGDNLAFSDGGTTIVFDKKNNKIINKTDNETSPFTVVTEGQLTSEAKGAFNKHRDEFGKNYFIFASTEKYSKENYYYIYVAILSNGGKDIKIIELENGATSDDYLFNFEGKAD